ncbi:hypothetical protein [Emticicia sp. BO119]|uniref:hypothetical protein n=1 Tax=Emticicia sp. BO119 TaxID=2757768 RepID=UPI0015F06D86|nr:hypothetical protein [Emticicia sp. BO119]MBA4850880.1 hypothetical protein [Emticicia sp. BO119]
MDRILYSNGQALLIDFIMILIYDFYRYFAPNLYYDYKINYNNSQQKISGISNFPLVAGGV